MTVVLLRRDFIFINLSMGLVKSATRDTATRQRHALAAGRERGGGKIKPLAKYCPANYLAIMMRRGVAALMSDE